MVAAVYSKGSLRSAAMRAAGAAGDAAGVPAAVRRRWAAEPNRSLRLVAICSDRSADMTRCVCRTGPGRPTVEDQIRSGARPMRLAAQAHAAKVGVSKKLADKDTAHRRRVRHYTVWCKVSDFRIVSY